MKRPPWEVADIIRRAGDRFLDRYRELLTWPQLKVLRAIERCRTAALGGHRDQCDRCGHQAISYNSCRNRHCPKCQTNARDKWLAARQQELLPVDLLPPGLQRAPHAGSTHLAEQESSLQAPVRRQRRNTDGSRGRSQTPRRGDRLLERLAYLGANLQPHPHIHCVVPGGGLSPDHASGFARPIASSCRSRF